MNKSEASMATHLTSGRLLARNVAWNLIGNVAPILAAVACIPVLVRALGTDRFGILTLAWAMIGYASLFDLGLSRAVTQLVARKLGTGDRDDLPSVAWTALVLMAVLGIIVSLAVWLVSPWLAQRGLNVPATLQNETLQSFRLLALSIPFVVTTVGLRGLLEAHQRFDLINAMRVPMGVFTFVGPILVLPFSITSVPVVGVLVIARIGAWLAHLLLCLRVLPDLRRSFTWKSSTTGSLLRFGGWMTVTNLIGPLMLILDRFVIGAFASVAVVAYYATPYEAITKVWLFPAAVVGVMFPAFSTGFAHNPESAAMLFARSVKAIFLVLFPTTLCAIAFARDGLNLWLGIEFAQNSFRVLQWLSVGVFMNSLAFVPYAYLQGVGRPDLTAKVHLIEFPFYLATLTWLIGRHGIEGAAIAWTARVAIDTVCMFGLSRRFLASGGPAQQTLVIAMMTLLVLAMAAWLTDPLARGIFMLGTMVVFGLVAWFKILTPEERSWAQAYR